ncbi:hypothetical protein D3C81_1768490 [compost metagenome]
MHPVWQQAAFCQYSGWNVCDGIVVGKVVGNGEKVMVTDARSGSVDLKNGFMVKNLT